VTTQPRCRHDRTSGRRFRSWRCRCPSPAMQQAHARRSTPADLRVAQDSGELGRDPESALALDLAVASLKAGADKIKPASVDAGPRVRLTGKPEWTPTPVTVACDRSVVCRLNSSWNRPQKPPRTNRPKSFLPTHASKASPVAATIGSPSHAAQLTLFYRLLPSICRIRAKGSPNYATPETIWNPS